MEDQCAIHSLPLTCCSSLFQMSEREVSSQLDAPDSQWALVVSNYQLL
jgi:hypothetical protein